jgi:hypothetical protein
MYLWAPRYQGVIRGRQALPSGEFIEQPAGAGTRRRIYLMRHADAAYFAERPAPVRPEEVALTGLGREQARAAAGPCAMCASTAW